MGPTCTWYWLRTFYFVGEPKGPYLIRTISQYVYSGAGSVSNSFSHLERNYDVFDGNDNDSGNGNDFSVDDSLIITIGLSGSSGHRRSSHFRISDKKYSERYRYL